MEMKSIKLALRKAKNRPEGAVFSLNQVLIFILIQP